MISSPVRIALMMPLWSLGTSCPRAVAEKANHAPLEAFLQSVKDFNQKVAPSRSRSRSLSLSLSLSLALHAAHGLVTGEQGHAPPLRWS